MRRSRAMGDSQNFESARFPAVGETDLARIDCHVGGARAKMRPRSQRIDAERILLGVRS
jgi:hypothetical protein